ncbi:MAG: RIP metalloprotease RseP [Bacteroidetes bacterium]|nr:RIP metalloprotease RseP [Bacteroidota bacterium]
MDILWILFTFIPALMILVFVHELGHFWAARAFGMRVDRFSIGFPPNVLKKRFGQTEYVLGITPLGGYVKIAGMIDESLDTDFQETEPQPDEYRSKPLWQRMIVITAGVVMNVILAGVIFFFLTWIYGDDRYTQTADGSVFVADSSIASLDIGMQTGDRVIAIGGVPFESILRSGPFSMLMEDDLMFEVERNGRRLSLPGPENIMTRLQELQNGGISGLGIYNSPSTIGFIEEGKPADIAGLQVGDHVIEINQVPVDYWPQLLEQIHGSNGDSLRVKYVRETDAGSREYDTVVIPEMNANCDFVIGVGISQTPIDFGPFESASIAWSSTWDNTRAIVIGLWRIASGKDSVRENLGGPVMVANIIGEAASGGARPFWFIVALLSITLAIINILPIPVLDGGHLAFLIYELFARKEPPLKVRMFLQQAGMILLLIFMSFLIINDIVRAVNSRGESDVIEPPPTCEVSQVEQVNQ